MKAFKSLCVFAAANVLATASLVHRGYISIFDIVGTALCAVCGIIFFVNSGTAISVNSGISLSVGGGIAVCVKQRRHCADRDGTEL